MKTCDDILELLSARLDGELTGEEEAALAEHLASCSGCAALAEDLEAIHASMPGLNAEPPAFLLENVMARIRETAPAPIPFPAPPQKKRSAWRGWGAAAAALVLVAAGAFSLNRLTGGMKSNTESGAPVLAAAEAYAADAPAGGNGGPSPDQGLLMDQRSGGGSAPADAAPPVPAPSAAPTSTPEAQPRVSTALTGIGAEDNSAVLADAACQRLCAERFADGSQKAESTEAGTVLSDGRVLAYQGMSGDGAYFLFSLSGPDGVIDDFAVSADGASPILSRQESGADFPAP